MRYAGQWQGQWRWTGLGGEVQSLWQEGGLSKLQELELMNTLYALLLSEALDLDQKVEAILEALKVSRRRPPTRPKPVQSTNQQSMAAGAMPRREDYL